MTGIYRAEQGLPAELALTHFTNSPTEQQRTMLLQFIAQIRQEIVCIASYYHLEPAEDNFLRSIMGEFSLLWCDLEDSRPQKLRRYGDVHPGAYDILGPQIERLIQLVLAIDGVASSP